MVSLESLTQAPVSNETGMQYHIACESALSNMFTFTLIVVYKDASLQPESQSLQKKRNHSLLFPLELSFPYNIQAQISISDTPKHKEC